VLATWSLVGKRMHYRMERLGASEPFTPNCIVQPGDGSERIDWFTHVRLYTRSGVALAADRRGSELGVAREREGCPWPQRQPEQFMSHTATIVHVTTPVQ
jgi:hypothetical protein